MYFNTGMYLTGRPAALLLQPLKGAVTLAGGAVLGFAVPAGWIKLGGLVQESSSASGVAFVAILVIFAGIVASYLAIIGAAGAWRAHQLGDEAPPPRRYNWNRSMRDERHRPPALGPLELLFVTATLLVGAAYMAWFVLFAGPSFPLN